MLPWEHSCGILSPKISCYGLTSLERRGPVASGSFDTWGCTQLPHQASMMDRPKATQNVQPGTNGLRHIFFDFDGTITTNDTIGLVAQAVLQWRRETCDEDLTRRVSASWQRIQDAYAQDMNNYESSQPPKAQRTTREAEIDHLRGRREIEAASLRRVNESGMFHGFGMHQLFQAGVRDREAGRLFLRDGFEQFIRSLKEADPTCMIHVLSVNWSASYIRGVLEPMCDFSEHF